MRIDTAEWVWPVPISADQRLPQISDGFHPAGNPKVRGGVGHRGQDIMYRRPRFGPAHAPFPWSSPHYEMLPRTPALAAHEGHVYRSGRLTTGFEVVIDHGDGIGTAYHHLSALLEGAERGQFVGRGQPIGIVGGSPIGYGLVHLHFDVAVDGRFIDAAKPMRRWSYVTLADAWGNRGRVPGPPIS
jgi:murein DD-endopeptidase MepM/ murein hydrolase activator NlpD